MAEGGIAAALANVDERRQLERSTSPTPCAAASTSTTGGWLSSTPRKAPDRVRELEAWGAVFDRTPDGRILQRNFGGHRYPRLAHVGDRTGLELIRTLQDHGIHKGIEVYMECTVVRLLKDGDRVSGAVAYYRDRGRFVVFKAKAVVLGDGGIGKAYRITSNSWEYTGDGHTLAYDAGAELQDMEFVQFHPTGMIWPPSVQGILLSRSPFATHAFSTRMPCTLGRPDHAGRVNCTNSMSCSSPPRRRRACGRRVYSQLLLVILYALRCRPSPALPPWP